MKKIFTCALLLVFLSALVYSQELSELKVTDKGKIVPEELIDKNIRDANGEVCAGLMIISDMDGFTYSSYDQVVKINRKPGKDLLFLSPEERVVEVYKTGFKPLKIILNEYGIRLASGMVWQMEISGNKADSISINIIPNVKDVKIYIDSVDVGTGNTQLVTAGRHELRLEKSGYKPLLDTIDVSPSNILFNYKLEEIELIPVQITSNPAGAKILINNLDQGETDKGVFLMPGGYKLKLIKPGYMEVEDSITVDEKSEKQFSYNLKMTAGILELEVEPKNANIFVNKNDYSNKGEIILTPGIYKLEIGQEGYYPVSETIEIKLGSPVKKTYKLSERKGGLRFSVQPLQADVRLSRNGEVKFNWQGMKILKNIQAVEYDLECSLKGYKTLNKKIVIEEGKTLSEDIRLEKEVAAAKEEVKVAEVGKTMDEGKIPEDVSDAEKDYGISKKSNTDSNPPASKRKSTNPPSGNTSIDKYQERAYSSKSEFHIRLGAAYGFNFNTASGSDFFDNSQGFSSGGNSLSALIDISFNDAMGLISSIQLKDNRIITSSKDYSVPSVSKLENYTVETTINVEYISFDVLFKLSVPSTGLYFVAGPAIGLEAKGSYESKLTSSNPGNTFSNGSNIESVDIQDLNKFFAVRAGAGLNIDLGSLSIAPQATYDYSLNDLSGSSQIKLSTIQAVVAVKLNLF